MFAVYNNCQCSYLLSSYRDCVAIEFYYVLTIVTLDSAISCLGVAMNEDKGFIYRQPIAVSVKYSKVCTYPIEFSLTRID